MNKLGKAMDSLRIDTRFLHGSLGMKAEVAILQAYRAEREKRDGPKQ